MQKEKKPKHFIQKPVYPGGLKAMRKFLSSNLKYPKEALNKNIEGSVLVRYGIDYKGHVFETKVISGLGYGCDEEAERIVKLLKFEVPKTPRKLKVKFHKNIRIKFKKPKAKKVQLKYKYSTNQKKKTEAQQTNSYHYSIVIKTS